MSQKRIPKEPAAKQPAAETPKPRRKAAPGRSNAAISRRLGGQPLDSGTRSALEQSYGADFEAVRLHRDSEAQQAAESLSARAFTQGEDITLGADAPPPESQAGRSLIAHELAHVVQQRQASSVDVEAVSQPGEPAEVEAQSSATKALAGQPAAIGGGAKVAGTQRDPKPEVSITKSYTFTRAEAEAILADYFEQQRAAQGTKTGTGVRITQAVDTAIRKIFVGADPGTQIAIEGILKETTLRSPADLAKRIARYLPDSVPGQRLGHLGIKPPSPDKPSLPQRVKEAAEKTAPAEQPEDVQRAQQKTDQENKDLRKNDPNVKGPYSVDVLRVGRIIGELTKKQPKQQPNVAPLDPAVETAIKGIPANALMPPGIPADKADNFADAQEVATDLARQLDAAHKAKNDQISINLGPGYNAVKDPSPVYKKLREIVQTLCAALPHHAPGVSRLTVSFGAKVVQFISLDSSK